jgi:hypothetical protein
LNLIYLASSIILIHLGLLSLTAAAAYWSVKGSGVAMAAGLVLIGFGVSALTGFCRRIGGQRRRKRS